MCWNTYFYSAFWISTKICPKNGPKKITFHILQNRFLPHFWPKIGVFQLGFFETQNSHVEQKHRLKSGKGKDKKKGFERKNKTGNQKKRKYCWRNICNLMFWCCSFHETKAKKNENERKRQKHGTKRKQKSKTRRKKQGQEQERDREREIEKGGGQKAKEKQRETLKNKQKMPLSRGKNTVFCMKKQRKERKKLDPKNKKEQEN